MPPFAPQPVWISPERPNAARIDDVEPAAVAVAVVVLKLVQVVDEGVGRVGALVELHQQAAAACIVVDDKNLVAEMIFFALTLDRVDIAEGRHADFVE